MFIGFLRPSKIAKIAKCAKYIHIYEDWPLKVLLGHETTLDC